VEEAEQYYKQAIALAPDFAEAHANLGHLLQGRRRLGEAEASFRKALELNSNLGESHNNLGGVLKGLGRLNEAVESFRRALSVSPDIPDVHFNLGIALYDLGRLEDAESSIASALALRPNYAEARFALTILRLRPKDVMGGQFENPEEAIQDIRELGKWFASRQAADDFKVVGALQPFFLAYEERNHRDVLHEYGKLCAILMDRWWVEHKFASISHAPGSVIRVGIVSGYVHSHSVWHAIVKGWLHHVDRERVELYVFYTGSVQDDETLLAKSQASHFEQGERELSDWVKSILDQQLDVLIYPEIGMDPMTLRLACLRLAPVQMAAWGHPVTTGLPTIDYYLSAEDFEPADAREHYTEKLVTLPRLGCCYYSVPVTDTSPDLPTLGIDADLPILLCPGTPFKYSPLHDWILPEIAKRLARCQFVFFTLEPKYLADRLKQRLRSAFASVQLDFERYVVFVPKQAQPQFHGLMRRSRVFLDTLGFSGFNTVMQAVACGLPIVAREGRFMRGRFASGILKRMQMAELVTSSDEDYISLAVKLASDTEHWHRIKTHLNQSYHVLCEDVGPVRTLEELLVKDSQQSHSRG
jgi:predicted O-linked N-acetylglucosamine transferase (SPINDLY family)